MKPLPRAKLAHDDHGHFLGVEIHCPACGGAPHIVPVNWLPAGEVESEAITHLETLQRWEFSKNFFRPTFSKEYRLEMDLEVNGQVVHYLCHSRIANGRILYLPDCTHAMAGQLTDLPDLPDVIH